VLHLNALDNIRHTITTETFAPHRGVPSIDPAAFDDLNTNAAGCAPNDAAASPMPVLSMPPTAVEPEPTIMPPESRQLSIPSTWQSTNIAQALRDAIADKSFQYSHVIRVAPRKGVITRARAAIFKINSLITYHCRVYGRCRAAMVRLGADNTILGKYRTLKLGAVGHALHGIYEFLFLYILYYSI